MIPLLPICSYSHAIPPPDRLSQRENLELTLHRNTGLMYKDAIAQLKNISTELMTCANSATCVVRLESLSIPTPNDFSLTGERYQPFDVPGKCFLRHNTDTCIVQCKTYSLGILSTHSIIMFPASQYLTIIGYLKVTIICRYIFFADFGFCAFCGY